MYIKAGADLIQLTSKTLPNKGMQEITKLEKKYLISEEQLS